MKRAFLVGAGTAVGLIATLSYAPADEEISLAADGGSLDAVGLGGPQDAAPADQGDQGDPAAAEEAGGDPSTAAAPEAGPADPGATAAPGSSASPAPTQPAAGGGSTPRGSTTSAPTSAKPAPAPTSAKPTPAPTSAKPAPAPTSAKPTPAPTSAKPTPAPTTAKPTPTPTAQDFTGTAVTHRYGTVQVAIRVLDGRIVDAWAVQYPTKGDSADISAKAIPKLRSSTLSAQSANIATVSGATLTSNAWKSSLQNALSKAGL